MILPAVPNKSSSTSVHLKNQLDLSQRESTVDAEGFEKAMLHLSESGRLYTVVQFNVFSSSFLGEGTFLQLFALKC